MTISKSFKVITAFYFSFLFSQQSFPQSYLLSSLPVEKDLSSRQVTSIFQDSKGFMWIGTEDGLNLYNANSVKIFKHDVKNKNSILDNDVQNICEDKNGNIWVANASGVDCYDPATNNFRHYTTDDQQAAFGFKPRVYADRKGTIWIGRDGLFRFNGLTQQFRKIVNPYSNDLLGSKYVNHINGFFQDSKDRYWVSTYDGLFFYDDTEKSFTRIDSPPMDDNYKRFGILFGIVNEDKTGALRVGTWGYGIFKILLSDNFHSDKKGKLTLLSDKAVILSYSSQQLNNKQIFWYASKGLVSLDDENKIQSRLVHQNDDPYSMRSDAIQILFTDKQNQLWIGYEKGGIQILSPGNQLIKTFPVLSEYHNISSIGVIAEKNNFFYVGGWYNNALCKLDKNYKIVKWWDYLPPGKNNSASNVGDIYFDKQDNLWIATANGLVYLNEKNGEIKNYEFDGTVSKKSFFLRILPEGDSVLWLAGYDNGLARFSLKTMRLDMYSSDPQPFYWKTVFDKTGNILCANNNGFIDKFDSQKKNFTSYHFDSLTERSIYFDIAYDSSSNILWAASSSGLLKIDLSHLHARLFTEKDGLPTSKTNLLTWDAQHRLWIGTDHGLSLYDPQKNSFRNFYINNGLSTEKLDHTLSIGSNGKLYIGSDNSFMTMDILALNEKNEISPVFITHISENGALLQPKLKNDLRVIDLPYYKNNLSFEFAITDFINPEDNQLFYQLEGWDQDFIQTKKGGVNYNKLPVGKYIFRVKGINHNGIKNDTGDAVVIIIHPPFWDTWWFIILVSVILLFAFIMAIRYIFQRNLKEKLLRLEKEQAVEKERNRISRDMHDDLGSGLTKIAIMSEVVKKQIHEPEKAKQQLENISQSSRELVDNLQDIIWILNPRNDTLESLAAYIREYALKFFEPFSVEVQFDYPEKFYDIKLSEETRRNIFLAIKESLNNIGKHAWCNKVKISIDLIPGKITITLQDDGKGFDTTQTRQFSNGLINMRNRIEQVGGKYRISSEPGKGTETKIMIRV
ncbi:MAG: two-component regulator propeller domain-containing protein [Chitinophagales bacterium]